MTVNSSGVTQRIRKPAVAGSFYSDNPTELRQTIESYLGQAKKIETSPALLISPHAGYVFSGPVAATGYAAVDKNITTVIIIGPSHHARFEGVSIADVDMFETPLGLVPLSGDIISKLRTNPIVNSVPRADAPEHSVEVQIPFLQVALGDFSIVPILTGNVDLSVVAEMLLPYVNSSTLVVASSDFSHYHARNEARRLDDISINTILSDNDSGDLDACGEQPIKVVMRLARKLALSPLLLDARSSFDTAPQYGSGGGVVGYASIAFIKKNEPA
jgi:hypothetical protein